MSNPCKTRFTTWINQKHGGAELGEVVVAAEHDAALAREAECQRQLGERWKDIEALKETVERQSDSEAALREELATSNKVGTAIGETLGRVTVERDDLHKRLTAAEQRNSDLVALIDRALFREVNDGYVDRLTACEELKAFLKPTESGASE